MTTLASPVRVPGFEYRRMPTGHFLPEEAPALVIEALRDFIK